MPWSQSPPYDAIPFEPWNTPAASMFFRHDPFHVFRLGIARNFLASALILLCYDGHYDFDGTDSRAVVERLARV